jgi:hypothetical protein
MPEVAEGAEEELRTEPMHLWDELIQLVPPSSFMHTSPMSMVSFLSLSVHVFSVSTQDPLAPPWFLPSQVQFFRENG